MTTPQDKVTVTDADREAYLNIFGIRGGSDAHRILAGEWDDLPGMQIIARHRQAAEAEAKAREAELLEALEELRAYAGQHCDWPLWRFADQAIAKKVDDVIAKARGEA